MHIIIGFRRHFMIGNPIRGCGGPGGRPVYATCSLLAEENEDIVSAFLSERGEFRRLHCRELLEQQGITLETGENLLLLPHLHGTDGFFAAAMTRAP
jgi:16S rRNA (cytosine967-C5)-methyltransferase